MHTFPFLYLHLMISILQISLPGVMPLLMNCMKIVQNCLARVQHCFIGIFWLKKKERKKDYWMVPQWQVLDFWLLPGLGAPCVVKLMPTFWIISDINQNIFWPIGFFSWTKRLFDNISRRIKILTWFGAITIQGAFWITFFSFQERSPKN